MANGDHGLRSVMVEAQAKGLCESCGEAAHDS